MIESLSHHTLLVFWIQILVIFAVARLLGSGAKKIGLPSVVGELTAGLVLGPTIFGRLWPAGFEEFLPVKDAEVQSAMLLAVSWFSAAFLLAVAGFETDLGLIRRLGKVALYVTLGSVLVPLVGGIFAGFSMPDTFYGVGETGESPSQLVFALFIATSVAVSALAVVAKILSDLGLMRRDVGQITIAAGMANDLVGWIILGAIAGLAASGALEASAVFVTVAGLLLFLAGALTIGQRVVDAALRFARRNGPNLGGALTVAIGTMLVFGVITQTLGVEAVLGAFVAGVVLTRSRYQQVEGEHVIEDLTSVIFAPLFFATAGLRVDVFALDTSDLKWLAVLLGVALGLKFIGSFLGAKLGGLTAREGLVLGAGLNARGALEIIIATVGLSLGVFNDKAFTMIVMIPLITSLLASIGLRVFSRNLQGSVAERERLAHEEALAANLLVKNKRILVPTLNRTNTIVASQICHLAWPEEIGATVIAIGGKNEDDLAPLENVFYGREVDPKLVAGPLVEETLTQSHLGYGVIAVGAGYRDGKSGYLSEEVSKILLNSEIPVVIARKPENLGSRLPGIFAQALVPVVASTASRAAQELAANLSARLGTNLMLSHVADSTGPDGFMGIVKDTAVKSNKVAESTLAQAKLYASGIRAKVDTEIRFGNSTPEAILDHAAEIEADLIVIGAQVRQLDDGATSLGPTAEYVLEHATQTVVVVALPDARPEVASQ